MVREKLKDANPVVVKVGSRVLLEQNGLPNYNHISHLVEQVAALHKSGRDVIFVSSGAIGTGLEAMGLSERPSDLASLQAAAAIGQVRLIRAYEDLFARFGCMVAQVLLTNDDLKNRNRHLNIKHTLQALLKRRIIPIINENDTVSVDEIKFSDNDLLASLVAMLIEAKALILLTTAPGFMITNDQGDKEKLSHIVEINEKILQHIEEHKDGISLGGMKSKIMAAANMIHVGGAAVIAPGHEKFVLQKIFSGSDVGTVISKPSLEKALQMPGKKRWIAFYNPSKGVLTIDDGAKKALLHEGKSLLPVGIKSVSGKFSAGSVVELKDVRDQSLAKGIALFSSEQIKKIMGKKSCDVREIIKEGRHYEEVVHRDNLVLLNGADKK